MEQRPIRILLVEDNPADVLLTRMTIEEAEIPHHLITIADGESALNYLGVATPKPDLMILDLNLPVLDGWQVLERIRQIPDLVQLPVVVMSSSSADRDRASALDLGAQVYFPKPGTLSGYKNLAQQLQSIWRKLVGASQDAMS